MQHCLSARKLATRYSTAVGAQRDAEPSKAMTSRRRKVCQSCMQVTVLVVSTGQFFENVGKVLPQLSHDSFSQGGKTVQSKQFAPGRLVPGFAKGAAVAPRPGHLQNSAGQGHRGAQRGREGFRGRGSARSARRGGVR